MYIANDANGNRVYISDADKSNKYFCPICGNELIVRQGKIMSHHYAHKAKTICDSWSYDISDWHREWQERFPEEYREVIVEHNGIKHRADVLVDNTVIKFQHSPMSSEEFSERNAFYTAAGYRVVWLFNVLEEWENEKMYYNEYNETTVDWNYPKRTFDFFEPHNEKGVKLYFQKYVNDIENPDEYGEIMWVKWKPENTMRRFKIDFREWSKNSFVEMFVPAKNEDENNVIKKLTLSDLYDTKYPFRDLKGNRYMCSECPLHKNDVDMDECMCCKYGQEDYLENMHNLFKCYYRFRSVKLSENETISKIITNKDGLITEILTINNGKIRDLIIPEVPKKVEKSLIQLWELYRPKVMRCHNVRTGVEVHLFKSPKNDLKKYGCVYGNVKTLDWEDFSGKPMKIFGAEKEEWICYWVKF